MAPHRRMTQAGKQLTSMCAFLKVQNCSFPLVSKLAFIFYTVGWKTALRLFNPTVNPLLFFIWDLYWVKSTGSIWQNSCMYRDKDRITYQVKRQKKRIVLSWWIQYIWLRSIVDTHYQNVYIKMSINAGVHSHLRASTMVLLLSVIQSEYNLSHGFWLVSTVSSWIRNKHGNKRVARCTSSYLSATYGWWSWNVHSVCVFTLTVFLRMFCRGHMTVSNEVHSLPPGCLWCSWLAAAPGNNPSPPLCWPSRPPPPLLSGPSTAHTLCRRSTAQS